MNLNVFEYNGLSIKYRKETEDEKVLNHSFDNDIFYREIPSFKPTKTPIIIDVGAHIGTFSLLTAIKYPNAKIYAIEASKETFDILKKNVEDNKLHNIVPIHAAMSDSEGIIKLFHSLEDGNWGHSITKELSNSFEEVKAIMLEKLIYKENIKQIDLIKFNCEGAELNILMNCSQSTLQKISCAIILYHEDLNDNKFIVSDLIQYFKKSKFLTKEIFKNFTPGRGWLIVWNSGYYSRISMLISKFENLFKKWLSL